MALVESNLGISPGPDSFVIPKEDWTASMPSSPLPDTMVFGLGFGGVVLDY
jgi:hypothetical protein